MSGMKMPDIFLACQEVTPDCTVLHIISAPLLLDCLGSLDCASSLKEGKTSVDASQLLLGWFNEHCGL